MEIQLLPVLFRWLHIAPVIIAIGGAFFLRMVVLPAVTAGLGEEQAQLLRSTIGERWRKVIYVCIALILISGMYNVYYGIVVLGKPVVYHMLFGVKLLCALAVFFLASALVGRSEAFADMRSQAPKWLTVLLVLATLIVLVSGLMKNLPNKERGDAEGVAAVGCAVTPGNTQALRA